jgi:hypothetical protein
VAYVLIEDLKGGVDRRRPIHVGKPGTLWTCRDAHITRGGDVEQRKTFAEVGSFLESSGLSVSHGLAQIAGRLYTFGSELTATVPGTVTYQRCALTSGLPMTELIAAERFNGRLYVIARFADGAVYHFYDGTIVADWNDGIVRGSMGSLANMAAALTAIIDASANFSATSLGNVITVTSAVAGIPFTVLTLAENGGSVDDQTLTATTITANVVAVTGVPSSFAFNVTAGDGTGTLDSVTVAGVEILGAIITWATSNQNTATLIAAQINTQTGTTGWAAVASGETVTVTKDVTGAANNGLTVAADFTNTLKINGITATGSPIVLGNSTGGVTAVAAVAQVVTLTLGGTFDPGDRFGCKLTYQHPSLGNIVEDIGNYAKPWGEATCLKTHGRKLYVGAGKILHFCAVNDAVAWDVDLDAGAGFLNASTHAAGSEEIDALGGYQGRLAIFSRTVVQLWTMENDDAENNLDQVLENTGTRAPRSVLEFAGNDVFYLDDSGIRSLKARDASNNAFLSDVGAPIDSIVRSWMRNDATPAEVAGSVAAIDPVDGRFWLAIAERIYVYTFFPTVGIAAWSWYEPGFSAEWMARTTNQLWCRAGDALYLYGGFSGDEYDDTQPFVQLPFITANKPGDFKNLSGQDMAAEGEWTTRWLVDPNDLDQFADMGKDDGVTYTRANNAGVGHATHVAPNLTGTGGGYHTLSQIAVHYQTAEKSG